MNPEFFLKEPSFLNENLIESCVISWIIYPRSVFYGLRSQKKRKLLVDCQSSFLPTVITSITNYPRFFHPHNVA